MYTQFNWFASARPKTGFQFRNAPKLKSIYYLELIDAIYIVSLKHFTPDRTLMGGDKKTVEVKHVKRENKQIRKKKKKSNGWG